MKKYKLRLARPIGRLRSFATMNTLTDYIHDKLWAEPSLMPSDWLATGQPGCKMKFVYDVRNALSSGGSKFLGVVFRVETP